jgi:hypothetical protein
MPDEPIEAVIDFDPKDLATKIVSEIHEEMSFHTGIDDPGTFMFVELFGLRPFNPKAWNMRLEEFVGYYGNSFVAIDLTRSDLGETEFFRPRKISGGMRNKFNGIGIENDDWILRAQFETRLVSSLIQWFQFFRKTKWLMILPLDGQKYDYRIWKVITEIPESNYSANWRIILPLGYPNEPPKLFISKKDLLIASDVDLSHIWKDPDGSIYYFISEVTIDSTRWSEDDFVADFLLTGLWNFLVRSLHVTFENLLFYKANLANPYIIKDAPPEKKFTSKLGLQSEIADSDSYEDDIDYKVEIAELQEEIDYNEETVRKRPVRGKFQSDDIREEDDDSDFDEDEDRKLKKKKSYYTTGSNDDGQLEDDLVEFDTFISDEEEEENKPLSDETDDEEEEKSKSKITQEDIGNIKFKEWVQHSSEEEIMQYGMLFTWLLLKVPEKALQEMNLLLQVAPDHAVFNAVQWRYIIDTLEEDQLTPFAKFIIAYYFQNTSNGEIYDTDREFLREVVLKKWKDMDTVTELKELLRKNVSQIRKVTYETLE